MRSAVALTTLAAALACASQHGVKRLADGRYRVECNQPLLSCLEPAAKLCELHGYDLEDASEQRSRYGPNPTQAELVKSSATVRCREADPTFRLFRGVGSKPGAAPAVPASAPPRPAAAAPAPVAPPTAAPASPAPSAPAAPAPAAPEPTAPEPAAP